MRRFGMADANDDLNLRAVLRETFEHVLTPERDGLTIEAVLQFVAVTRACEATGYEPAAVPPTFDRSEAACVLVLAAKRSAVELLHGWHLSA